MRNADPAIAAVSPALILQGCIGNFSVYSEFDGGGIAVGQSPQPGAIVAATQSEPVEESRRCRSSGVEGEPGGGLGAYGLFAVVAGDGLDVDAAGSSVGVGVLDLRIRIQHAPNGVDREGELVGDPVPFGIGGPPTVLVPRGPDGLGEMGAPPPRSAPRTPSMCTAMPPPLGALPPI